MSYCGVGSVPAGKKRGTIKQCIQSNQVRYYGLKKFDKELLKDREKVSRAPTMKKVKEELIRVKKMESRLHAIAKKVADYKQKVAVLQKKKSGYDKASEKKPFSDKIRSITTKIEALKEKYNEAYPIYQEEFKKYKKLKKRAEAE